MGQRGITAPASPALYIFAISHFCEKGRWTLDHHAIDYQLRFVGPGFHSIAAGRLGAPATTYPILVTGEETIQGSDAIVDWADVHGAGTSLTPEAHGDECRAIETRLGEVAGVHTRRMFYSEAMVEHPGTVKPVFTKDLPFVQKSVVSGMWPLVRRRMIESLDLGREQGEQSQALVDGELKWLEGMLADGREFLVGNRFTRADLSACALFSRLAAPAEHPGYRFLSMPPRLARLREQWQDRPALRWIRDVYRTCRRPTSPRPA